MQTVYSNYLHIHPFNSLVLCYKLCTQWFLYDLLAWILITEQCRMGVMERLVTLCNVNYEEYNFILIRLYTSLAVTVLVQWCHNFLFIGHCWSHDVIISFICAGVFSSSLVAEITDGSSNVREVWKLSFK